MVVFGVFVEDCVKRWFPFVAVPKSLFGGEVGGGNNLVHMEGRAARASIRGRKGDRL